MAIKFQVLFNRYGLHKKVLIYVKDEGANLGAMTTTLKKLEVEKTFPKHMFWAHHIEGLLMWYNK